MAISIKWPPEHCNANRELLKTLAEQFEGSEYRVKIISGLSSRKKDRRNALTKKKRGEIVPE